MATYGANVFARMVVNMVISKKKTECLNIIFKNEDSVEPLMELVPINGLFVQASKPIKCICQTGIVSSEKESASECFAHNTWLCSMEMRDDVVEDSIVAHLQHFPIRFRYLEKRANIAKPLSFGLLQFQLHVFAQANLFLQLH